MTARSTVPSLLALGAVLAFLAPPAAVNAQGGKPRPPDKKALEKRRELEKALENAALQRAKALDALKMQAVEYKKAVSAAQKRAAEGKVFAEAEVLRDAYMLLAEARHDYEGHRHKAMHQIEGALKILDAEIMKKGTPLEKAITALEEKERKTVTAKATADVTAHDYEDLLTSAPRLEGARYWLVVAQQSLAQNKKAVPLEHVDAAIKQIDAALKEAKEWHKFMQAEALRQAYLFLAWANHDYGGHRHKAMIQVQDAVNILDADIMKNGDALLKAREAVEKKWVNGVRPELDALPEIHEIQLASDLLLKNAREWLHLLRYSLAQNRQEGPLKHVDQALKEIKFALEFEGPRWTKLQEDMALQEAYFLLAAANNDPGSYRAKAMHQIEDAVKILNAGLMQSDKRMGKAMKALEKEVDAGTKVDEHLLLVSDIQFRNARGWLILVQRALVEHKQEGPLKHVEQALKELNSALKIE
jgi:hypothetical protein